MRITLNARDGVVGVDGLFRKVDVSDLAPEIGIVQFDTVKSAGHIEYDPEARIEVPVRDHPAEAAALAAAGDEVKKLAALVPLWTTALVPIANKPIGELGAFAVYVDRWTAAAPAAPSAPEPKAQLEAAVQQHLDSAAQAKGYDSIFTAATYADEPAVGQFQTEGRAYREWRSLVWAYCIQALADIQAGKRVVPSSEQLIAELPVLKL